MQWSPFRSRKQQLRAERQLVTGGRVRYCGAPDCVLKDGSVGTIVSDVPGRMDVTPFATPPTVPEEDEDLVVDVDFDGVGRRSVPLDDLVADDG